MTNAQNIIYFHTVYIGVYVSYTCQTLHFVRFFSSAIVLSSRYFTKTEALLFKKNKAGFRFLRNQTNTKFIFKRFNSQLTLIAWPSAFRWNRKTRRIRVLKTTVLYISSFITLHTFFTSNTFISNARLK